MLIWVRCRCSAILRLTFAAEAGHANKGAPHYPTSCSQKISTAAPSFTVQFSQKFRLNLVISRKDRPSRTTHWEEAEDCSSLRASTAMSSDLTVILGPIKHIQERVSAQLAPWNSQGCEVAYQLGTPQGTSWHGEKNKKPAWCCEATPQTCLFKW